MTNKEEARRRSLERMRKTRAEREKLGLIRVGADIPNTVEAKRKFKRYVEKTLKGICNIKIVE